MNPLIMYPFLNPPKPVPSHTNAVATWTPKDIDTWAWNTNVGVLRDGDWNMTAASAGYSSGEDAFLHHTKTLSNINDGIILAAMLGLFVVFIALIWKPVTRWMKTNMLEETSNDDFAFSPDTIECDYCRSSVPANLDSCSHCGAAV